MHPRAQVLREKNLDSIQFVSPANVFKYFPIYIRTRARWGSQFISATLTQYYDSYVSRLQHYCLVTLLYINCSTSLSYSKTRRKEINKMKNSPLLSMYPSSAQRLYTFYSALSLQFFILEYIHIFFLSPYLHMYTYTETAEKKR